MDGPQEGAHSLPELVAAGFAPPPDPGDADAIAHLSYTSGTTGQPKGACLAHEPTVRAIALHRRAAADHGRTTCRSGRPRCRAPISWSATSCRSSTAGATINVMGRWTQPTGYDALDAAGATMLIANPPVLDEVLAESRARGRTPGRLRMSLSGGGPVPPTLKAAWRDELGVPLVESYGQSELGGFVALGFPELGDDRPSCTRIGPPLPDKEVRVVGADDAPLPLGEIGDIVLRGGFMTGYWGKPGEDRGGDARRLAAHRRHRRDRRATGSSPCAAAAPS